MNPTPRILITEDERVVALDLERRMEKLGFEVCAVVSTGEDAVRQAAALHPDLVLMDICLGGEIDGIDAATRIRITQDIPVIYLTANADETTLRRARATHPASYLLKPFRERELQICIEMGLANHRLQRELHDAHDRLEERVRERTAELAAANTALRTEIAARAEAQQLIRDQAALLDKSRDAIFLQRLDGTVAYWNRSAERLYGVAATHALGRPLAELFARPDIAPDSDPVRESLQHGEWIGEIPRKTADHRDLTVESRWTLVRDEHGAAVSFLVVETDITERKILQAQFLRAQRLESIGALASGIAHDLNNVFTPLIMAAQMIEDDPSDTSAGNLGSIISASARRGADMVRQILLFVRGGQGEHLPLKVEHIVKEVQKLLAETLPRSIRIRTRSGSQLRPVIADATQLHQLLMNLCVNARDAMPAGGELAIDTENFTADEAFARDHASAAGHYLRVTVSDTGTGIPPDIRARLFTPFFTTKAPGKGTGLGLSTVQAIVRDHDGFIDVESSVGNGTRFIVYLPACDETRLDSAPVEDDPPQGHGEELLLAEDEAGVREIAKATLEAYGYRVTLARDGVDALAQFARRSDRIACVIVDGSMPFLDGAGCVLGLRRLSPHVPVLVVSGNGAQSLPASLENEPAIGFLAKPYTKTQLLTAVHRCLHATPLPTPV